MSVIGCYVYAIICLYFVWMILEVTPHFGLNLKQCDRVVKITQ